MRAGGRVRDSVNNHNFNIIGSLDESNENIPFVRTLGASIVSLHTIPNETDCKPILVTSDIPSDAHPESSYYKPDTYSSLIDQERMVRK